MSIRPLRRLRRHAVDLTALDRWDVESAQQCGSRVDEMQRPGRVKRDCARPAKAKRIEVSKKITAAEWQWDEPETIESTVRVIT